MQSIDLREVLAGKAFDLMACAHCGKHAEFIIINKNEGRGYLSCTGCRMETPVGILEKIVEIWNRRIQ